MDDEERLKVAQEILGLEPLPTDAEERLEQLQREAESPDDPRWSIIWEGFEVATMDQGETPER